MQSLKSLAQEKAKEEAEKHKEKATTIAGATPQGRAVKLATGKSVGELAGNPHPKGNPYPKGNPTGNPNSKMPSGNVMMIGGIVLLVGGGGYLVYKKFQGSAFGKANKLAQKGVKGVVDGITALTEPETYTRAYKSAKSGLNEVGKTIGKGYSTNIGRPVTRTTRSLQKRIPRVSVAKPPKISVGTQRVRVAGVRVTVPKVKIKAPKIRIGRKKKKPDYKKIASGKSTVVKPAGAGRVM